MHAARSQPMSTSSGSISSSDRGGGTMRIHAGHTIDNPVTGERIVFRETSAENGGRRVLFDTYVRPGGFVAAVHVHPYQVEWFEVESGRLGMRLAHNVVELEAGDEITVL